MKITNLQLKLGKTIILKDINASFKDNVVTVLLGKNGSGKTTLIRAMGGLIKYHQGNIILNDRELNTYKEEEKAALIAYLPQYLPRISISVEELIILGNEKTDKNKIDEILDKINLKDKRNQLVCHLSGGERTMAYLGLILNEDTPYVILDEPFASLDLIYQDKLMEIIKELKNNGKTIILSVHDLSLALNTGEDFLLLDQGKSVFQGNKDELLNSFLLKDIFSVNIKELKDNDQTYYVYKK